MASCGIRNAILTVLVWCPMSFAQQSGACREYHPWGEFQPGAWKLVRVLTETLDENGLVTGTTTTETRTTLMQADERGITLEIATTVEVAGKRFEAGLGAALEKLLFAKAFFEALAAAAKGLVDGLGG